MVPGAAVKLVDPLNPVRSGWLADQGFRLAAAPYLSGAYEARKFLERLPLPTEPLHELPAEHDGGVYNGPQFPPTNLTTLDPDFPFSTTPHLLSANFSNLP